MTKKLLFVTTILLVLALAVFAADVTGKWTFEQQGRNGAQTITMMLKADGSNLTGTVDAGRGGPAEIKDGKIDGDNISFNVVREFNGNTMTTKYAGTVSGDEIKLTVERPGRDGNTMKSEVVAKKAGT
jgi:hypothetical protein